MGRSWDGRREARLALGYMTRRRWLAAVATLVALAGGFALVGTEGAPLRQVAFYYRHSECIDRPNDGGGIAAVGDSITVGQGKPSWGFLADDSWLSHVVCGDDGLPYSYNGGVADQTTEQISEQVDEALGHDPDVLVILAGTNDVYRGDFSDEAIERIRAMVADARDSGAVPILGTLVPIDGMASEVLRFNDLLVGLAAEEGVAVIDFHAALADEQREGYRDGLTRDGLHPSRAGAFAMAEAARPVLSAALDAP